MSTRILWAIAILNTASMIVNIYTLWREWGRN